MNYITNNNKIYRQIEPNEMIPKNSFFLFKDGNNILRPVKQSVGKCPSDFINCIFYVLDEPYKLPENLFNIDKL